MNRRSIILAEAQRNGQVSVDALAQTLGVSAHTIRRDINALCEDAKLRRLHGGAEFVPGAENLPYSTREVLNFHAKRAIAKSAAALVDDGATVFISIGTTPALVAAALAEREALTVITNNLNAAMAISANNAHRVILPGGELRLPDRDILGEQAIRIFSGYRADFGIYGVAGIDGDGSLLDFHEAEVRARQEIHGHSRHTILVADHTKFGRRAAAVGGALQEADTVVLDARPDAAFSGALDSMAGQLILAPQEVAS